MMLLPLAFIAAAAFTGLVAWACAGIDHAVRCIGRVDGYSS